MKNSSNKMKNKNEMKNNNQHHKNLTGGFLKESNIPGSFYPLIKKMITEVVLVLPLYLILFFTWWGF